MEKCFPETDSLIYSIPIRSEFRTHVKSRCFKLGFRANAPVASDDYHGIYLFRRGSRRIDPTRTTVALSRKCNSSL